MCIYRFKWLRVSCREEVFNFVFQSELCVSVTSYSCWDRLTRDNLRWTCLHHRNLNIKKKESAYLENKLNRRGCCKNVKFFQLILISILCSDRRFCRLQRFRVKVYRLFYVKGVLSEKGRLLTTYLFRCNHYYYNTSRVSPSKFIKSLR
jgi:hypothetical protein